jgi:hypothetical protein
VQEDQHHQQHAGDHKDHGERDGQSGDHLENSQEVGPRTHRE